MAIRDLTSERLFVDDDLAAAKLLELEPPQAHYLTGVLRLRPGAKLLVFNGRDGEWVATLAETHKRRVTLQVEEQARPQESGPDIDYLFAPLKRARLDYMVQKATEMGIAHLQPVLTHHTVAARVNLERMRANGIEAAEQCGILRVPTVGEPLKLEAALAAWNPQRRLIFCDEGADVASPLAALAGIGEAPLAVLIGPEGGFDNAERVLLREHPSTLAISLGPRIMRADTAAVAALALVNAALGDWR
jgi:16S rRNA (uracil1498-N3)-methyltransferase